MAEDEIDKIIKEMMETTRIERERAAEYAKLSYHEKLARRKGFANNAKYEEWLVQQKGFVNLAEYGQDCRLKRGKGTGLSMAESRDSASYLGIHIAERLLPKIFQEPRMMPHGNKGFDAICKNNYKIEIKSSVLYKDNRWNFHISQNKIADFFFCIGFNNRINLEIQYIWLIPGNDVVRNKKLNEFYSLYIYDTEHSRSCVAKYVLSDKLEQANNTCVLFKKGVLK